MGERSNVAAHYFFVFCSFFPSLSVNEFVSLGMLGLGAGTFFINWWYKKNHLRILENKKGEL